MSFWIVTRVRQHVSVVPLVTIITSTTTADAILMYSPNNITPFGCHNVNGKPMEHTLTIMKCYDDSEVLQDNMLTELLSNPFERAYYWRSEVRKNEI